MWLIEIEPFFPTWLIEIEPVFPTWLKEIEPFFSTWLWLIFDSKNWTFFLSMSQRIELFSWLKELNFFQNDSKICWKRLKESNLFFEDDPKNRTSFYWKYVLRIVFQYYSHNWTYFQHYLKNGTFEYDSKSWTFFDMTPIIEPWKFQRTDFPNSKNWTSFEKHDWKNFSDMTFFEKKSKNFSPFFLILRNALNFFLGDDSKNWTLLTRLKDLRIFLHDSKTSTFWTWLKELSLFSTWLKELNLFWEFDSMDWTLCTKGLKELDTKRLFDSNNETFLFMTWGIGPFFFLLTQRIELFLKNYWPFLTWLTELNSVLEHDSPNWTFFFEEYDS